MRISNVYTEAVSTCAKAAAAVCCQIAGVVYYKPFPMLSNTREIISSAAAQDAVQIVKQAGLHGACVVEIYRRNDWTSFKVLLHLCGGELKRQPPDYCRMLSS